MNFKKIAAFSLVAYGLSVGNGFGSSSSTVPVDAPGLPDDPTPSRYHTRVDHTVIQDDAALGFINNPLHGDIYLTVEEEALDLEGDLPRLGVLKGLRGLKVARIGDINARIPGLGWHGGTGAGHTLADLAFRLRVLDLGLDTPSGTFKLDSAGSVFLAHFLHLEELNLCNHYITGGTVNLQHLVHLRRLNLYNNKIGASVAALVGLTKMEVLDLGNNSGMSPAATRNILRSMQRLKEVDLSYLGVSEAAFNGWFTDQLASAARYTLPILSLGVSGSFGLDFGMTYRERH